MTKYRILAVPDVAPAECANCGSSKNDGRGYIDFGLQIDWHGVVYLCGNCLFDIAKAMRLFEKIEKELEDARSKIASLEGFREEGEQLHEGVRNSINSLREYYERIYTHNISFNSGDPNSGSSVDVGANETASTEPTVNESEQGTTKQTTSSRRKNVPSLTELLNQP
jgi:hypothetical protein